MLHASTDSRSPRGERLIAALYAWRWPLSLLMTFVVAGLFAAGGVRVQQFTSALGSLGDTTTGAGAPPPLVFDPRMDLWFGAEDEVVGTYRGIEDRFVAEDYIMVTFEAPERELGVFDRESLSAIARLTEGMLEVPGVRHVRSLTSNPWIRSGLIEDEAGDERGLLISDLVEGDPAALTDDELLERMIAVLGAARTAERVGEDRVRAVLGADASFADHIGEPLLLGTIVSDEGTTTAIQVQVLRPRVDEDTLDRIFGEGDGRRDAATTLYSVQAQRSSLRGIEHVLRLERGLAVPTPELEALRVWVESLPDGDEKQARRVELADPSRNFMRGASGELVRKFHEYDRTGDGAYVDASHPGAPVAAPPDFTPEPLSPFAFHVGGVPNFERNFEEVGMADSKYMAIMFLAVALLLVVTFRSFFGVVAALFVVFGGIFGMLGGAFAKGDLLNNMTMISPNMLTAVAMGDAVHMIASWTKLRHRFKDKRELMIEVLRRNALPVMLTSITTAIGFASLTISEMVPVHMFGYTAAFGAILAWGLSMTVVPALLSLAPLPSAGRKASPVAPAGGGGWEDRLSAFTIRARGPILAVSAVLLACSLVGLARLRIDSDFRSMFPDDNPTMADFHWIESRMGGVGDLEIVFDGGELDDEFSPTDRERIDALRLQALAAARNEPGFEPLSAEDAAELQRLAQNEAERRRRRIAVSGDFLATVDAFEARLREEMADPDSPMAVITDLSSPLDILRQLHRVQHGNRASYYRTPLESDVPEALRAESLAYDEWTEEYERIPAQDASTLAAQYYLQYENGAKPGENLATQVSMDRTKFRMQGRIEQSPTATMLAAVRRIETIAATEFPLLHACVDGRELDAATALDEAVAEVDVSGKMYLFARTTKVFTLGFVQSMSIALVAITILIGLFFRSTKLALVSLVPNVLPILVPLSVFGLVGLTLDAPAIFVSSVALGVCVDDSLHFFTHFRRGREGGQSVQQAVRHVFETTGRAISISSIILVLGFGTLILSDFAPNFMMGTLAAIMISLAWVADMIVTPAVLSFAYRDEERTSTDDATPAPDVEEPALASA